MHFYVLVVGNNVVWYDCQVIQQPPIWNQLTFLVVDQISGNPFHCYLVCPL